MLRTFPAILAPAILALSVSTAWAADNTIDHSKQPTEPAGSAAAGAPQGGGAADKMAAKQERMLKIHKLMHEIDAETDPAKREALMKEQAKIMHEGMMRMHRGKGCGPHGAKPST